MVALAVPIRALAFCRLRMRWRPLGLTEGNARLAIEKLHDQSLIREQASSARGWRSTPEILNRNTNAHHYTAMTAAPRVACDTS